MDKDESVSLLKILFNKLTQRFEGQTEATFAFFESWRQVGGKQFCTNEDTNTLLLTFHEEGIGKLIH
ncbi:hypothetical protein AVEN_145307-1, partial [Araneus ventricosus]